MSDPKEVASRPLVRSASVSSLAELDELKASPGCDSSESELDVLEKPIDMDKELREEREGDHSLAW